MKQITDFPTISLSALPTPICRLENLSRQTGKNIYIKRDDLIGTALGGNKVRKLEFLLADAQARGADTVLTAGGPQSNHAMLTAACAGRLGMRTILVLKKRGKLTGGNQVLNSIYDHDGASEGWTYALLYSCRRLRAPGFNGLSQLCAGDSQSIAGNAGSF